MTNEATPGARPDRLSRRGLLLGAAVGTLGASAALTAAPAQGADQDDIVDLAQAHAFYGRAEQAGIKTPQ